MDVPSLQQLCKRALVASVIHEPRMWRDLNYSLPPDLVSSVLVSVTPIALQVLQEQLKESHQEFSKQSGTFRSKRKYVEVFESTQLCCYNSAWKIQANKRWPLGIKKRYCNALSSSELDLLGITEDESEVDWQQRYWEAHLQECLNEAAAQASAPFYEGSIGDVILPDGLLAHIGLQYVNTYGVSAFEFSALKYHFCRFGQYARYLRIRSVLCSSELINLLISARLQHVAFYSVTHASHVEGLCLLLRQNKESLRAVEFHYCKFSSSALLRVAESMTLGDEPTHFLHHFFVISSSLSIQDDRLSGSASGFVKLLHSCRYLQSAIFFDNQLDSLDASRIFFVLLQAASSLSILHVSENELEGLFVMELLKSLSSIQCSNLNQGCVSFPLKVLDLRSNSLDSIAIQGLSVCLKFMPLLEQLNLSDNPIEDDGIRALVPYLQEVSLLELNVSSCGLSSAGVSALLEALLLSKQSLKCLSMAHNCLGRSIASPLGKFLSKGLVERLDIEDVGLGPVGCSELQEVISHIPNLTHLIIRLIYGMLFHQKYF
eukprot:c22938_g1_i2 orf=462-2096(-)